MRAASSRSRTGTACSARPASAISPGRASPRRTRARAPPSRGTDPPHAHDGHLAESEGFEPPSPCGLAVFKTAAFDRSANSPGLKIKAPGPILLITNRDKLLKLRAALL